MSIEKGNNLYVTMDRRLIHSHYSDEKYGEWSETWTNDLGSVSLSKTYDSDIVDIDYDIQKDDIVYVLWAEWSSGNSFGYGENNSYDIIHVFRSKDIAKKAYEILISPATDFDEWSVNYETDTGISVNYFRPWLGYFERDLTLHLDIAEVV